MKTHQHYKFKRNSQDRRKRTILPLKYLLFGGKRKTIRRREDQNKLIILDNHNYRFGILAIIILILSVMDGLLTLNLIELGAFEINPIVSTLVSINPYLFIFIKYLVTAVGIVILILFNNYRSKIFGMRVAKLLSIYAIFYIFVIGYELYLKYHLNIMG